MGVLGSPSEARSVDVFEGTADIEVERAEGFVRVIAGAAAVIAVVLFGGGPLDARFEVVEGGGTGLSREASYVRAMRSARGTSSMIRRSKTDMAMRRESGSKAMSPPGSVAAIVQKSKPS